MLILIPSGMPFHAEVVFILNYDFFFKSFILLDAVRGQWIIRGADYGHTKITNYLDWRLNIIITKQNDMNWQQDKIGLSKLHKILWNVPVNYNGQRLLGTLKQECRKIVIESCQVKICRISWLNLSVKLASEDKVKRRWT